MLLETEYLNQEHLNGFDKYKVSLYSSELICYFNVSYKNGLVHLTQPYFLTGVFNTIFNDCSTIAKTQGCSASTSCTLSGIG